MIAVTEDALVASLQVLYEERFDQFARVAAGIAGGEDEGKDAVHSAFVECLRTRSAYRERGKLEAWVWRAVITSALKYARSNRRNDGNAVSTDANAHRVTDDPFESTVNVEVVRDAVKSLPEQQRTILFLRYYADLDYVSIASVLEIRPGTVGAALNKAHSALRRVLGVR